MDEKQSRWLYFALGVTTVISLGGVVNQVSSAARDSGVILGNDGIRFPDGSLQTTAASPDSRRAFYLTSSTHQGNAPLNACAPGFHFASMWEIHEGTLEAIPDVTERFESYMPVIGPRRMPRPGYRRVSAGQYVVTPAASSRPAPSLGAERTVVHGYPRLRSSRPFEIEERSF